MPRIGEKLAANKERLLFAAAVVALAATGYLALRPLPEPPDLPEFPRVIPPKPAEEIMGADKLFAGPFEDYWDDSARYVFVQPPVVRVFKPVSLEVPTQPPPRPPLALPSPGPFLQFSGALPRLGEAAALPAAGGGK